MCVYVCVFTIYYIGYYRLFVVLDEEINIFKFPNPIVHESRLSTVYNPKGEISITILFMTPIFIMCVHTQMHKCMYLYILVNYNIHIAGLQSITSV